MNGTCYQVNLQTGWGGGEVYTKFFTRALDAIGIRTVLFAAEAAIGRWREQLPPGTTVVGISGPDALAAALASYLPVGGRGWLVFQTPATAAQIAPLRAAGHLLTCFAHMPLYGRDPASLRPYDLVVPVSGHVLASLHAAGITHTHDEPLYGVADLSARCGNRQLRRRSCYDWDRRKLRDRLFGVFEPAIERLRPHPPFARGDGIALGIVSRLTPIKQFPLLFSVLAPVLARHPAFRLEVFGNGGYASVRDLRQALAPIRNRVRFWGQQADVATAYRQLDYLLTGLPEKEALGLNIIEAQACGLPVIAVDAPPFTETVAGDVTGLFYTDPRNDNGVGFDTLLTRLAVKPFKPDPVAAAAHLQKFSTAAFAERVVRLVAATARLAGSGT
ncbi:MAG TPA: glycosyltransferase family 4 protein [Rhodocyclaceae bacterium]|nr:glycosyltransferase family 4 protein [Rhodocyclaceae bacterium]